MTATPNTALQRTPPASPVPPLSFQALGATASKLRVRMGLALACIALSACRVSRSEIHLIPTGYTGDVFIVFGQPSGVPAEYDGLASVFRIPADGILVTQDTSSAKWHLSHYYRIDSTGAQTELELEPSSVHDTAANRADTRPIAWFPRSTTFETAGCRVEYHQYYVGTRADLLSRDPHADELRFEGSLRQRGLCASAGA
jgi:hypothetical protein